MKNEDEVIKVVMFDLNGTFYTKSSKDEFYKFICKKRPNRIKYLFEITYYKLLVNLNRIKQTEFKENFFNYLDEFPPQKVEEFAKEFWEKEFPGEFHQELKNRFDNIKSENILLFCATGGLEIYVKPLFGLYKIDGFAGTKVNYSNKTYLVDGVACKEEEKIKRLEKFLDHKPYKIIEAYSDSEEHMLKVAEKSYLIKDGKITNYK